MPETKSTARAMAVIQRIDRGDVWKSKARSLQLRLRERFRVAVVRRPIFARGYFSDTVRRWNGRFRDFRRDSLPSSTSFYRKRVAKNFNADEDSTITRMLQAVAVPILGNVCHVFMHGLNRVQVYGAEKLHDALLHRPKNKPLLTVSNHVASVDDPFVIASLLPPSVLLDARNLRWTLCASDRCFKNPVTSAFFRSVKVLPVSRGDGIYQKGMDIAISKLNSGGWVHIFPEGSRSWDGGKTMRSSKRGVGRLVLDADNVPIVVPFVHTGMQDIMPIGAKFPRVGKTVTVLIGDPIIVDDLVKEAETNDSSRGGLYDAVASRIGERLHQMKAQVDRLALEQLSHSQNLPAKSTEQRAAGIIHKLDWESLGMESYITSEADSGPKQQKIQFGTDPNPMHPNNSYSSCSDWDFKTRVSSEEGIVRRMRNYMDPTELVGFAARGLFASLRSEEGRGFVREVSPLKAWRNFLEANMSLSRQ